MQGAERTSIEILIDADDDSATGAVVTTARGPFFGADQRVQLVVDGNAATLLSSGLAGGALVRDGYAEVSIRIASVSAPRVMLTEGPLNFEQQYDGDRLRLRIPLSAVTVAPSATRVWYVRNTGDGSGDGSAAAPFRTLSSAQFASAPGDVIYVFAGDGTIRGQDIGIVLKDGQSLIGEGVPLVVDGVTVIPAGQKPMITSLAARAILLANNNVIRGLTIIEPKGAAILDEGGSVSGLTLDNVTILRPAGEAVRLTNATGTVTISRCEFNGGPGELVKIDSASNLLLEVKDSRFLNTAPPSGDDAIQFVAGGSGLIRFVASGNTFQNLHGHAIDIGGRGIATDAFTLDVELTGNSFLSRFSNGNERGTNGVSIKAQEHELVTVAIANNTFNTVGGLGALTLHADDSGTLRGESSRTRSQPSMRTRSTSLPTRPLGSISRSK